MLIELMKEIENGGTLEINHLARKLKTSPQIIAMMIEQLQQSGFIKPYESCSDGCESCSLGSLCTHNQGEAATKIWKFEKAEK